MFLIRQRFHVINTQISKTRTDAWEHSDLKSALFSPTTIESLLCSSNQIQRTSTFRTPINNLTTGSDRVLDDERNLIDNNLSCTRNVVFTGTFHTTSSSDSEGLPAPFQQQSRTSRLRLLAHVHGFMFDTAQVLNSAFSVQNLLFSAICLVDMTVHFYFCFLVLFKLTSSGTTYKNYMYYCLYLVLCSAPNCRCSGSRHIHSCWGKFCFSFLTFTSSFFSQSSK